MTRILVVDDHEVVRRGLIEVLSTQEGFEVVAEASSLEQAKRVLSAAEVDVAIVDIVLPDGNGLDLCVDYCPLDGSTACIAISGRSDDDVIAEAAAAGARAYLPKGLPASEMVQTVRDVAAGKVLLDVATTEAGPHSALDPSAILLPQMTVQERRLLAHLADGSTSRQIAAEMHLAEKTVKNYVSHLLMKFEMARRTELVVLAARLVERGELEKS